MEFFMAMIPPTATHQEKKWGVRNGKPYSYEPQQVKDARAKLRAHLAQYRPGAPFTGAVAMKTAWYFPISETSKKKHFDGEYKTTKPDTDNLNKMLKDVMTELGFWNDDAQVVSEYIEKRWGDMPGIAICVESINNSQEVMV